MNQKGTALLLAPLLILFILAAIIYIFITLGIIKSPLKSIPLPQVKKETSVSLQKQYQNPFDKNTQYVNPFSSYQNPFETLK